VASYERLWFGKSIMAGFTSGRAGDPNIRRHQTTAPPQQ
jgi:hypothetical protein